MGRFVVGWAWLKVTAPTAIKAAVVARSHCSVFARYFIMLVFLGVNDASEAGCQRDDCVRRTIENRRVNQDGFMIPIFCHAALRFYKQNAQQLLRVSIRAENNMS